MPTIHSRGFPLFYDVQGSADAPALMLSNSLCTDMGMWEPQLAAFTEHFRVIRYDRRGHGQSGVPVGPYSIEDFGRDALAILDDIGVESTSWCGLSMGGMVGQWLAANAPERIHRLMMSNTHFHYADKSVWDGRIALAKEKGMAAAAGPAMSRWFTQDFAAAHPDQVEKIRLMFAETSIDGYIACCSAIRDMDMRPTHARIMAPTMVIIGLQDPATPPQIGTELARRIPNARLAEIDSSHISNVGQPEAYARLVIDFMQHPAPAPAK